jgi:hypothetical protein
VICSVAFSIPRAGFFKLYSIRTANPNKTPSTRLYRSDYAKKLTKVIAGRTVKAATVEPSGVLVLFDDQSNIRIKTAGPATIPPGNFRVIKDRVTNESYLVDQSIKDANGSLSATRSPLD